MIVYKATDHAQHESWFECETLGHLHKMIHGNPSRIYEVLTIVKISDNGEACLYANPEKTLEKEGRRLHMVTLATEIQDMKADLAVREALFAELEKESK